MNDLPNTGYRKTKSTKNLSYPTAFTYKEYIGLRVESADPRTSASPHYPHSLYLQDKSTNERAPFPLIFLSEIRKKLDW